MPRPYCTISDVKRYLPSAIIAEGDNPDPDPFDSNSENLPIVNIMFYINQASAQIESALKTQYDVPFCKINEGGVKTYPTPIPEINALLAAMMIYEQRLQGADGARSESQKDREAWAVEFLKDLQNGEAALDGARRTRGSRFVRGTLPNVPRNPAEGGRSKGRNG